MARNSLGIFLYSDKNQFPFIVFRDTKGLNFLEDSLLFNNPTTDYEKISPECMVTWK